MVHINVNKKTVTVFADAVCLIKIKSSLSVC